MRQIPDPMRLLSRGVPLTLLLDLFDEKGLDSRRLYAEEHGDASWLQPVMKRSA
jgi:hypothetical protein